MSFGAIALYLLVLENKKHAISHDCPIYRLHCFPLVTNIIYQPLPN